MNHKIRLGPVAVFLAVIAVVLACLAMLSVATSRADTALAERFASVTKTRYELEADGERFLAEADKALAEGNGRIPDGAEPMGGGLLYYSEKDGYELTVRVEESGSHYTVAEWKISRIWEEDDPMDDLWPGL